MVLGLDQSPRGSGYCHGDGSGPPAWGYRDFNNYGDNEAALIAHIRPWIRNLIKSTGAQAVFTEQILATNRGRDRRVVIDMPTLLKQCAVVCAIATECGDLGVDHYEAPISEWRVTFMGIGGAPRHSVKDYLKDLAMKECADRGFLPKTHHEAEAIGIWSYGLAKLDPAYRARSKFQQRRAESRRDEERRERVA
jgi:hypothetical protein